MAFPYGDPAVVQKRAHPGVVWAVAAASGVLVYALLLAIHLPRDTGGTTAFRAGEMMPVPLVCTVVAGIVAQFTARGEVGRWLVPALVPVAVATLSLTWYAVVQVLPGIAEDARAEESGQDDYELAAPARVADWKRVEGKAAEARAGQVTERMEPLIDEGGQVVYAEYQSERRARMTFVGINASGGFEDELRDSTERVVRDTMAGARATGVEEVDEGDLGGSMSCASGVETVPVDVVLCVWADASTSAQVIYFKQGLSIDTAAAWARDLRDAVTRR